MLAEQLGISHCAKGAKYTCTCVGQICKEALIQWAYTRERHISNSHDTSLTSYPPLLTVHTIAALFSQWIPPMSPVIQSKKINKVFKTSVKKSICTRRVPHTYNFSLSNMFICGLCKKKNKYVHLYVVHVYTYMHNFSECFETSKQHFQTV